MCPFDADGSHEPSPQDGVTIPSMDPTVAWIPEAEEGRVRLVPLGAEALVALDRLEGGRLAALTRLVWPQPVEAPPLVAEHLDFLADRVRTEGAAGGWWNWAIATGRHAAGVLGCSGPLTDGGVAEVGYSLYPGFRGQGLASGALRLAIPLILARPGVTRIRATVPVANEASQWVAHRAGLSIVRRGSSAEDGETLVFEGPAGTSDDATDGRSPTER